MTVYNEEVKEKGTGRVLKSFWRVDITWVHPDGRKERVRKTPRPNTRKEAEKLDRSILQQLADGTWGKVEVQTETLASFRPRYFRDHVAKKKASMQSAQETIWRVSILPLLGEDTLLSAIDEGALATFAGKMLARKASPKTTNNALSGLRTALVCARRWKLLDRVPEFEWVKGAQKSITFFDYEETDRILAQGAPMVTVAIRTGMRIGELLALQWPDVSFARGEITVERSVFWEKGKAHEGSTKSTRIRHLPMTSEVVDALRPLHRDAADKKGPVFASSKGKQLTRNAAKSRIWPVLKAAEVRKTGWHVCRHTFASHLVMAGAPIASVQKLMGHATIQMTMRYAHLAPGHLRDVMALLEPKKPLAAE